MANTGYKGFTTIEEYFLDDNSATGASKANACYLPQYVEPVYDDSTCPVGNNVINIDPYSLQFDHNSGSQEVSITSNYDNLSFGTSPYWITLSETGNPGNMILTISVGWNGTGQTRYDDINIYHGTEYLASIYVEQSDY